MDKAITNFKDLYRKHNYNDEKLNLKPLWHYTSAEGLTGIIRQKEKGKLHFWFTRSDCLNDASEGNHILNIYHEVCEHLLDDHEITKEFYNQIKDIEIPLEQFINYPVPPPEDCDGYSITDCLPCDSFICSFSLKQDSLDMWRYYSKGNGGYGLKLKPFIFDDKKDFARTFDYQEGQIFSKIIGSKVIYDKKVKEDLLRDFIKDSYSVYQNFELPNNDDIKALQGTIRFFLKDYQFKFKHECYKSEQEYRFIFYRPCEKPKSLMNELPDVKYRTQNGIIVPYIDVTVDDGISMLDAVMISPYIQNSSALDTTNTYLKQNGFNCAVEKSSLPVRF